MQSAKETAANAAASAKAGLEKTRAAMQEKGEKMATRDPLKKDIAEEKKEERMHQAELQKQEVRGENAATRQAAAEATGTAPGMGHGYTAGGDISTGTGHTAEEEVPLDRPRGTDETGRVLPQDPNVRGRCQTGL